MSDLTAHATWREIHAQPAIWRDWVRDLPVSALRAWVSSLNRPETWFCGAGSSAYLGDILCAHLPQGSFRARPTTDVVSRPGFYLGADDPLVVSFGRSGNSAESLGLLDALDALAPAAPRLNITCNAQSALARRSDPGRAVILPAATHDAGFAMTSSFTTMLLTALAVFDSLPESQVSAVIETLSANLSRLLPTFRAHAEAARLPSRVVFLGTGPLAFSAREAALKVMELSAGQIAALWDSTLGFRHGPKSFVNDQTDIWLFGAMDPTARAYEADLLAELRQQFPASRITHVGPGGDIDLPATPWNMVLPVVLAQVLAVVWSDRLGLNVDDPFAGRGTLTRVVSGVRLHPVVRP